VGDVGGLRVGVTEDERRGGQDEQFAVPAPVPGQASLDVGEERLTLRQRPVPGENGVGGGCRELATVVGVTRLEDDRPALGAAGTLNRPLMSKCAFW